MRNSLYWILFIFVTVMAAAQPLPLAAPQPWKALGPEGGSVRSLAYDPQNPDRVFLGTSSGTLYLSINGGASWARLAHLGNSEDMALDNIAIDPTDSRTIYVAAWSVGSSTSGDLFRSHDGGQHWETTPDMHDQSIRALAMASSDPKMLVAGTLEGVFRSSDGGDRWERISPEHHAEIKNVESIAIDPVHAGVIYAGTWHLPWKTEDGGKTWHNIKQGVIDDSDVFSIVIDSANPSVVFASACSGIYKSESGGELFHKIQGIPYSARRTRVLRMDPVNHDVVYAGTTEGLWKTTDSGATWKRMTGPNLVVNAVMIDPRNQDPRNRSRVLLATDRGGVLASEDGAASFAASNRGFTHRQVASLLVDRNDGSVLYAGLLNDKEFGGVFVSHDAGQNWEQISEGLEGRDVFVLRQTEDGEIVAGTNQGVFKMNPGKMNPGKMNPSKMTPGPLLTPGPSAPSQLNPGAARWQPLDNLAPEASPDAGKDAGNHSSEETGEAPKSKAAVTRNRRLAAAPAASKMKTPPAMSMRVSGLELGPERWFAATSTGLLTSTDHGGSWRDGGIPGAPDLIGLGLADRMVVAASRHAVFVSVNGGESWLAPKLSDAVGAVNSIAVDSDGTLWIAAREGAFRSTNAGDSWQHIGTLPLSDIAAIQYDRENHRLLATGEASTGIFETTDNGRTWRRTDSGWRVRTLSPAHGRLIAATPFDGVVIQPDLTTQVNEGSENGNQ